MDESNGTGVSRRGFLRRSAVAGAGVVLVGASEVLLTAPNALAAPWPAQAGAPAGYGPLVADPAGRLALPEGFRYTVVTDAGVTRLESGEFTPGKHDGTGAFRSSRSGTVLVNNHEIGGKAVAQAGGTVVVAQLAGLTYDPGMGGGCTVIETDRDGNRITEYVGIAGTSTNCAGGITPWNTWLTCEEASQRAGEAGAQRDHGYVFEVDAFDRSANQDPQPIKTFGRYAHEACAVDPRTDEVYLTEDASGPNGLVYRWGPPAGFRGGKGRYRALGATEGSLTAMRCLDEGGAHVDELSRATVVGTTYRVEWVTVPDRDARLVATRRQFGNDQITRSRKLEGAWWGDGGAYIVASYANPTDPGSAHDGQVWFYDPRRATLTLRLQFGVNPDPSVDGAFDGPDNITVSPWGGVILAEDGDGIQHLIGATPGGQTYALARNEESDNEFTGPVFSADRRVLFANVQTPGTMFAITGRWRPQV